MLLAVANLRIGINSLQCILATRLMAQRLQPRLASLLRMLLTRGPYICGIECSDQTSLPTTNAGVLISLPNTSFRIVGQEDGSRSVVATYSSKNVFPDFVDNLQARMTQNPVINWYAKVFASPQGVDIEKPINVVVIIEYNVTLSDVIGVVDV